jgi:hypothetical protein
LAFALCACPPNAEDADGDGFTVEDDCDDTNADVRPDASDLCNALSNLDLLRFDVELDDPNRPELNKQRAALDAVLDTLVDAQIDETTAVYAEATSQLAPLNEALEQTLDDLNTLKRTLETVAKVVSTVNQVARFALPLLPS